MHQPSWSQIKHLGSRQIRMQRPIKIIEWLFWKVAFLGKNRVWWSLTKLVFLNVWGSWFGRVFELNICIKKNSAFHSCTWRYWIIPTNKPINSDQAIFVWHKKRFGSHGKDCLCEKIYNHLYRHYHWYYLELDCVARLH